MCSILSYQQSENLFTLLFNTFRVNVYDGLYNEVMSKPSNSEKTKTQRAFAYIPEFFAGYLKTGYDF